MIAGRFENQVNRSPQAIAITADNHAYTYEALNQRSTAVWRELSNVGIQGPGCIGLLFSHGFSMIASLFGVLKAGMTYVPLPDAYPVTRHRYIAHDSKMKAILTDTKNLGLAKTVGEGEEIPVICTDQEEASSWKSFRQESSLNKSANAYVLYTSGSTGHPKGVVQTHDNVLYFIDNYINDLSIHPEDRLTCISSLGHDAAVMDIFGALLSGASLHLFDFRNQKAADDLSRFVKKKKISLFHSVPTVFRHFAGSLSPEDYFSHLRAIVLGGEAVIRHDIHLFRRFFTHTRFHILYGQTESSYNTLFTLDPGDKDERITLGTPIHGTDLFIVDKNGVEADILEAGEIVIESRHLALEYLNDPGLTEEKFIDSIGDGCDKRLYMTGDMGRKYPDGAIEFMGRIDHQIKIRGFRVEPGDIETHLLKEPRVKEACVVSVKNSREETLIGAYLVTKSPVTPHELRSHLSHFLPDYMIPSLFQVIDQMPLLSTNKVDRKSLPPFTTPLESRHSDAITDDTAKGVSRIWSEVLHLPSSRMGMDSSFFELGGDSLSAIRVVSRINESFQIQMTVKELFDRPTIGPISSLVTEHLKKERIPIRSAGIKPVYALSSEQERMYVLNALEGIGTSYNLSYGFLIEQNEIEASTFPASPLKKTLERFFSLLIERHEILRSSFAFMEGKPVQKIHESVFFHLTYKRVTHDMLEKEVLSSIRPFDLSQAPLFRAALFEMSPNRHVLVVDFHHIVSDRTSFHLLVNEFSLFYENKELPKIPWRYVDYAMFQENFSNSPEFRRQKRYWLHRFSGEIPVLDLPMDFHRPPILSFDGEMVNAIVEKEESQEISRFLIQEKRTLFTLFLTAFLTLLYRYTGQKDIIVGTAFSGREIPSFEPMIGMFVKTIALRNFPDGQKLFRLFLREVHENAIMAQDHPNYPFSDLIKNIAQKKDASRNPLFDVMLVVQNMDLPEKENGKIGDLRISPFPVNRHSAICDLTINVIELKGEIHIGIEYNTRLLKKTTVERIAAHLHRILLHGVREPDCRLSQIEMVSAEEKRLLTHGFNTISPPCPIAGRTFTSLFEETASRNPQAMALSFENQEISYETLHQWSARISEAILAIGVTSFKPIPLMADPGPAMIAGIIGILKAGRAFLPIDPGFPDARIHYIIEESDPALMAIPSSLTQKALDLSKAMGKRLGLIFLDCDAPLPEKVVQPAFAPTPHDPAYVIYTSGSTGKPKGVVVTHGNLLSYIAAFHGTFSLSAMDRILQQASFCFDTFIEEVFPILLKGGGVIIPDRSLIYDTEALVDFIHEKRITLLSASPLFLNELNRSPHLNKLSLVHTIISGGDLLKKKHINHLLKHAAVYNTYGPTEGTVCATYHKLTEDLEEPIPIGKPLPFYRIYLLDENWNPVPIGVKGEICIGGAGPAKGYLNQDLLTRQMFMDDPFFPGGTGKETNRIYLTGDMGRFQENGAIQFLGRKDEQISLKGYRIEPKEIEAALISHPDIEDGIVVSKGEESCFIVGYYVSKKDLAPKSVRRFLSQHLPAYMIPAYLTKLSSLPVTINGKIDKNALPDPRKILTQDIPEKKKERPFTEMEKILAGEWETIMGIQDVCRNDHFFDLGGDSLKAIQLAFQLGDRFIIRVEDIFMHPTLSALAEKIQVRPKGLLETLLEKWEHPSSPLAPVNRLEEEKRIESYRERIRNDNFPLIEMVSEASGQSILLTGGTGFFGSHAAKALLAVSPKNRIFLIVRGLSLKDCEKKIEHTFSHYFGKEYFHREKDRLIPLPGDITAPALGLEKERWRYLSETMDAVVHAAADVKHYGDEERIYRTNVLGTQNALQFAHSGRKKRFHHLSTLSVRNAFQGEGRLLFTEYDLQEPGSANRSNIYARTKQEAEERVLAFRDNGLSASIYRLGNLVFHSETGQFQENIQENGFYLSLRAIIALGAIPAIEGILPDFTFIDHAAAAFTMLFSIQSFDNQIFHLLNPNEVSIHDAILFLKEAGIFLTPLAPQSFLEKVERRLKQKPNDDPVMDLLFHGESLSFSQEDSPPGKIASERTIMILQKTGFAWPKVNAFHIGRMIAHCREVGFIEA